MMKKLVIALTVAVLGVYLVFVLVNQVYPYVQWMLQREDEVRLTFDTPEQLLASERVNESVKPWLKLPAAYPEGAALEGVDYADDRLTTPQMTLRYARAGTRYMNYSIGGNYDLSTHRKLKSAELGAVEGDLLVGRDGTVVIKWRDADGPPYRYVYFFDPALAEDEMIRIAASFAAAALPTT